MSNQNDFIPDGYEVPRGSSNYLRLQTGENRFRILSRPLMGWLDWKDNKPLRFPMNEKPEKAIDPKKPIKHFWAMTVWNCNETKIQILEITQQTIQAAITDLSQKKEWGAPWNYDLVVTKKGSELTTEYHTTPIPPSPVAAEIRQALLEARIDLGMLMIGEDPFGAAQAKPAAGAAAPAVATPPAAAPAEQIAAAGKIAPNPAATAVQQAKADSGIINAENEDDDLPF